MYIHPQQIFEKAKKRGEGSECWLRREAGQVFHGFFYFCRLPVMCIYSVYVNGAAACLNVHLTINNMYTRCNSI